MYTLHSMATLTERATKGKEHLLQVRVTEDMFRRLRAAAGLRGTSATGITKELIEKFLQREENSRRAA